MADESSARHFFSLRERCNTNSNKKNHLTMPLYPLTASPARRRSPPKGRHSSAKRRRSPTKRRPKSPMHWRERWHDTKLDLRAKLRRPVYLTVAK